MIYRFIIFLCVNFLALFIAGIFTAKGVPSDWYQSLNKAPWTPPGWAFGAAWSTIMICFAFYMTFAWQTVKNRTQLITLFTIQWVLNVLWSPVFFYFQNVALGLVEIVALTFVVGWFLFGFVSSLKLKSLFVLPYFLWLLIAVSLNAYILLKN